MKQDFRRSNRKTLWILVAVYVAMSVTIAAGTDQSDSDAQATLPADTGIPLVTDARICAATAAYTQATGDFWDQRAAIARAALNRYAAEGNVPDCGQALTSIVADGVDSHLWQASLDAVDAVQSGSYALPDACVRADTVSPAVQASTSPLSSADSARTHCVLSGLAFTQTVRP